MTTKRYVGSLVIGLLVGLAMGLFIGWEQVPVEYTNSSVSRLAPRHQEEYTLMVAEGYLYDRDINGALQRLEPLQREDVFDYVQTLTERHIIHSNVPAIVPMVALSEGLGRLTPLMEVYRSTPSPALEGGQ
jgi:hypothetical protein